MQIIIDREINRVEWIDFIKGNQYNSPFQSPGFYDLFNKIPNQTAIAFAIKDLTEFKALCVVTLQKEKGLKGYFSRRAIIYGGPVVAWNCEIELETLIRFINSTFKNKVIYLETRNLNDYTSLQNSFLNQGWIYKPHLNIQIKLNAKSLDGLLNEMKYNRKREIKLSKREGATYKDADSIDEVKTLYSILVELYKMRVNLPLPDLKYFIELYHSPIGKVFIVKHEQNIIGGSFCLYYANTSICTLYYCGLRNYHTKIYPTHLAVIAAMEFGIKNNLQLLDLMGAGKPGVNYGVRNYKTEFGGNLVENGRNMIIYNHLLFKMGSLGLSFMKILK